MSIPGRLWERFMLGVEDALFGMNRWTGIAQYAEPERYLGEDRETLFARCARAGEDLLSYLRPRETPPPPYEVVSERRGDHEKLTFASPLPSGIASNDTVTVHRFRARSRRADGTLLFHHPAFRPALGWIEWFTRPFRDRFHLAVMEMPFHLSRAPEGTFSGERLINANPVHLYEGVRQWMAEHRTLLGLLESEAARGDAGARPVALVGYSLGGYLSALYSLFDPRWPVIGICVTNDYARGVFEGALTRSLRSCIAAAGITRADWEVLTHPLKLHLYAPGFPADRFFLVSGRFDRVEPFASIERFHRAFQPRRTLILPSGHVTTSLFYRNRIIRETFAFLEDLATP